MTIQTAALCQLPQILELYQQARRFMAQQGNPTQWGTNRPSEEQLRRDIADGCLYLCMQGQQIAAVFCLRPGPDETYAQIWQGSWLNDRPYQVIHRLISARILPGAAAFCIQWALQRSGNLRIDTHENNIPMRNLLQKLGFHFCGVIRVEDGTPRLAYQKEV